jgi:hypothetical protein
MAQYNIPRRIENWNDRTNVQLATFTFLFSNITKPGLDRIVGGKLMVEIDLKLVMIISSSFKFLQFKFQGVGF